MKIELEQRSPDWFAFRKGKIGSSGAPTIMGCNPFQTKAQLWQQLKDEIAGIDVPKYQSDAMKRGSEMEPEALQWINSEFLGTMFSPAVFQHDIYPWLIASLDGYAASEDLRTPKGVIVEIKCSPYYYGECKAGRIPDNVFAQMQHQMLVSGTSFGCFVGYDGFEGCYIHVTGNAEYQALYLKEAIAFYESLKLDDCPFSEEKEFVKIELDEVQADVVNSWIQAKRLLEIAEANESALRADIIDLGDDGHCDLVRDGLPILRMQRCKRDGNVDWKRLCKERGISDDIVKQYRKPSIGYYKLEPIGVRTQAK